VVVKMVPLFATTVCNGAMFAGDVDTEIVDAGGGEMVTTLAAG